MKKVLLAGTALVGLAALATPAHAELKLNLGGYFSGYGVYADNSPTTGAANSLHTIALRRDTEVHVTGESTLDNGLTVGFHTEQELGGATLTDEAYAYFSGGWGRVNLGSEDGSAYLLQVAAPSADSNVDGLRTYIQALNPKFSQSNVPGLPANVTGPLDYDHVSDPTGKYSADRITYLTPKFSGFQAGVSFAPETGQNPGADSRLQNNPLSPMPLDKVAGAFNDIWEASARWDGEFQGFGLAVGGGYSRASLEAQPATVVGLTPAAAAAATGGDVAGVSGNAADDIDTWNGGASVSFSGFTLGGAYTRTTTQDLAGTGALAAGLIVTQGKVDVNMDTWDVGLGWDNGPYHLGGSYLNRNIHRDEAAGAAATTLVNLDADRWTVGGGYTYGPGMTFRGAVAWGSFDPNSTEGAAATAANDFTQVTVGTEIDF